MPDLSLSNRKSLLQLARNSIEIYLTTGDRLIFETDLPQLNLNRSCFITLRKNNILRGCIGTFNTQEALYKNVMRMAVAAAFQDPRFPPLTRDEFPVIKIEISVLGELEKVHSLDEIEIGKHGIYIKFGPRNGTYLPDVAVEQKWSVEEFVMHCAREKAHLSTDEISRAEIFRYKVEKFKE